MDLDRKYLILELRKIISDIDNQQYPNHGANVAEQRFSWSEKGRMKPRAAQKERKKAYPGRRTGQKKRQKVKRRRAIEAATSDEQTPNLEGDTEQKMSLQ